MAPDPAARPLDPAQCRCAAVLGFMAVPGGLPVRYVHLKAIAFSAILSLMAIGDGLACSCERNPTAAGILAQSTMVFTGIARSSVVVAPGASATTFEVTEGFKGAEAKAFVVVRHPTGPSASCGVQFETGQSVTLAAHQSAGGLSTTSCSTWMFLPHVFGAGADQDIGRRRRSRLCRRAAPPLCWRRSSRLAGFRAP
jgi:hypothetical protein